MDSAILVKQATEKVNGYEKEEIIKSLPGSISNVKERLIALSPAVFIGIIMGGLGAVIVSILASMGAIITYSIYKKVNKQQEVCSVKLVYYIVLLIALMPATTPWWQSIWAGIGITLFYLIFDNKAPFNISIAVWLILAFWGGESQIFGSRMQPENMPYFKMYIANARGGIGEFFLPAVIAGGGYLLYKKIINWTMVLSFIGTVLGLSFIGGDNPLMHFLSGSLVLGVIFLTPDLQWTTNRFKFLYGMFGGILALGLRYFGDFLTAVPLAILIMDWLVIINLLRDKNIDMLEVEKHEKGSKEENHIIGWVLFFLAILGLVSSIFTTDASPLREFFNAMGVLYKFSMIVLFYLILYKLSSPRIANYNLLQLILSTLVVMTVII